MIFRPQNFIKAKRWLTSAARIVAKDGQLDFPGITFEKALISVLPGVYIQRPSLNYWIDDLTSARLAEWAKSSPESFDAVAEVCADYLLSDQPMPIGLQVFAAEVLSGRRARPKRGRGRPPEADFLAKSFVLGATIAAAKFFNLKETRDDKNQSAHSACDAMAEALTACGVVTTYDQVKALAKNPAYRGLRKRVETYELFALAKDARPLNALAISPELPPIQDWPKLLEPPQDGGTSADHGK